MLTFRFMSMGYRFAGALGLTALLVGCSPLDGPEPPDVAAQTEPIINGSKCTPLEHPSAVAVIVDATMNMMGWKVPMRTVMCTGTLIAPDVVLTAAHCVNPSLLTGGMGTIENAKYYISFASDLSKVVMDSTTMISGKVPELPKDAQAVTSYVANPGFTPDLLKPDNFTGGATNLYDIAIMFLKGPVPSSIVKPAVVITKDEAKQMKKGVKVDIAGWGQQSAKAQNPLTPAAPGSTGVKVCATSTINELGTHEMQIGGDSTTSRKCHGDSGGPSYMAVQTTATRKERVVGITSHAYDNTDCAKGGVDTRVNVWLDWLDKEMTKGCTSSKRSWCEVKGIIPPSYYDPKLDKGTVTPDGGTGADKGTTAGDGGQDTAAPDDGCSVAATPATLPGLTLTLLLLGLTLRRKQ